MAAVPGNGVIREAVPVQVVWALYRSFLQRHAFTPFISRTAFYVMAARLVNFYGVNMNHVVQAAHNINVALAGFIRVRLEADLISAEPVIRPRISPVPGAYRLHPNYWVIRLSVLQVAPFAELIGYIVEKQPPAIGLVCKFGPYANPANRGNARSDWVGIALLGKIFLFHQPLDADFVAFFNWLFAHTDVIVSVFDGNDSLAGIAIPPGRLYNCAAGNGPAYGLHECADEELGIFLDMSFLYHNWTAAHIGRYAINSLSMECIVPLMVWYARHNWDIDITDFQPDWLQGFPHY